MSFFKILQSKFEGLVTQQENSSLRLILSSELAFQYRQLGISRSFTGLIGDFFRLKLKEVFTRIQTWLIASKDPYDVYDFLVDYKTHNNVNMLFMFQLGDYSIYSKNINFRKREYIRLIKSMGDYSEIGLMLSHEAIYDITALIKEIKRFENIANHDLKSIIIKDRSINFPNYYVNLDETDVKKDYSMGYFDKVGFRTGTFTPHLFYDLNLEQASPIEVHPYYVSSPLFCQIEEKVLRQKLEPLKNYSVKCNVLLNNSDFKDRLQKESILKKISIIKECLGIA